MADDIIGNATPDISGIIGELLSNKELMAKLGEIADNSRQASSSPPAATGIEGLISNPDLMSKLPEVMGIIKPLLSGDGRDGGKSAQLDKRIALLMALKPYLSPRRCEAVDYIARMSKLSETVKGLKL